MNSKEKAHIEKVVSLGCVVCSELGIQDSPAEAHHIGNGTMGKKASNFEVIPLCPSHHRLGGYGVAVHAGRKAFESAYGTERGLLEIVLEKVNE
ncbi:recombination enhancement RecA-dependent nuclease [Vibrio phage 1.133.O._10N.222.51.E4]|nr:recombination enhancement RecA-dependent nuclease [Vibrio phage 1.133.O._10N.222.51.E4]